MNNIATLLNNLIDKTKSIQLNNLPAFNWVNVWNDSYNRIMEGKQYEHNFPACYIEVKFGKVFNLGGKLNGIDIEIKFHILHWELDAIGGSMDQNLNVFTYRDLVHRTFQSYTPVQCSAMRYKEEMPHYGHRDLYHHQLVYGTHYIDQTAYGDIIGDTIEYGPVGLSYSIGLTQSIN